MKPHIMSLLTEKLRQREMRAALTRSKRITQATSERPRPILDALTAIAKETGKPGEEILNEFVSGKASFPALDAALASHHKTSAPTITAKAPAAPAARPAAKAPAPKSAYQQYLDLRKIDPQAATRFFEENRKAIYAEADAGKGRQSPNR